MNQYLAGVRVKIAEEWKPAGKRVETPADLLKPVISALTEQDPYDFKVERNALAFVSERREKRRKEAEERAARLAAKAEECEPTTTRSASPTPVTSAGAIPTANSMPPVPPPTAPVASPGHVLPIGIPSPVFAPTAPAVIQERPLAVVPFKVEKPSMLNPVVSTHQHKYSDIMVTTTAKAPSNDILRILSPAVNLKDFEDDAGSPFDQMELKTIDEVQELASVLQNTHIGTPTESHKPDAPNGFKPNENSAAYFNNYGSFQPAAAPQYFAQNVGQQAPSVAWPLPSWYNYSGGVVQSQEGAKGEIPYSYNYYSDGSRLRYPETAVADNQPVVDRPVAGRSSSVPRQPATNLNKASSISVPNLSAELDFESLPAAQKPLVKIGYDSPRPVPERSRTPPATAKGRSPPVSPKPRKSFELPDVFSQMPWEVKSRVNHIAEMGFPRDRVARCWKKMKGDDKKVIEHLLLIQSLVDAGYPGEFSEIALDELPRDQPEGKSRKPSTESRVPTSDAKLIKQATHRICIMAQFADLGFPMDRIVAALRTTSWDRDKALDILLT